MDIDYQNELEVPAEQPYMVQSRSLNPEEEDYNNVFGEFMMIDYLNEDEKDSYHCKMCKENIRLTKMAGQFIMFATKCTDGTKHLFHKKCLMAKFEQ